ncbi:endonuclease VII domain-containing protein [Candidatus Saccharibacteria bacterium]|nr:endonuclease VII domain-containing protein [Candidatus Saccharibacteria bacterium]
MRICTKCLIEKEETDFPAPVAIKREYGTYMKRRPQCKDCVNEYQRRMTLKNNPSDSFEVGGIKRSKRKLWEVYRMTPDEYIELFESQEGLCAICRDATASVVDHCHQKGHVRALLCQPCNVMLGAARDNVSILARGIEYLNNDVGV